MVKKITILLSLIYLVFYFVVKFYFLPNHFRATAILNSSLTHWAEVSKNQNIDYLVVGDITALTGILPKMLSANSYSIALSTASMMDIYYQLKKTDLTHVEKGIVISNTFFVEKHYEVDFWDTLVLGGFYDFSDIVELYKVGEENGLFPYSRYSKLEYFSHYLRQFFLINQSAINSLASYETTEGKNLFQRTYERIKNKNGFSKMPAVFKKGNFYYSYRLHFNKYFYPTPTDDYYFKKILELTKGKNVFFILPPLADKTHKNTSIEKYKIGLESYLDSLKLKYPLLHYYASPLSISKENFYNFYTLYVDGAVLYSQDLSNYLRNLPAEH
jgi:hypothetical protein